MKDRERKLIKNVYLFSIGNFFSKILQFIIIPLLTFYLSTGEYGVIDIIITMTPLITAIFSLSIVESVFRFSINDEVNRSQLISNSILVTILGSFLLMILVLFLTLIYDFAFNPFLIGIYWTSTMIFNILHYLIKGMQLSKRFISYGILFSVFSSILLIVFVIVLKLGINGYFISYTIANIVVINIIITNNNLLKHIKLKFVNSCTMRLMLKYSTPLILNTTGWLLMNLSSKIIVASNLGLEFNGIVAISFKIPLIISMVYTIFYQAFSISAIADYELSESKKQYSMFHEYISMFTLIAISILILLIEPFTRLFIDSSYYLSWKYVPIIGFSLFYSGIAGFYGVLLTVTKESKIMAVSTLIGGGINLIFSLLLINILELYAVAISFFLGNIVIYYIRKRYVKNYLYDMGNHQYLLSLLLICLQVVFMYFYDINTNIFFTLNFACVLLIILVNRRFFTSIHKMLRRGIR